MDKDKTPLEQLYAEYGGRFYAAAYAILQNKGNAEDAVSETFLRLIKNREKFDGLPDDKKVGFAKTVLKNIAVDMIRKRNRHGDKELSDDIFDMSPSVEAVTEGRQSYDELLSLIRSMPPSLCEALYLRVNYGFDAAQTAKALGISRDAARKRLSDAYKLIRKFKEENGNE